MQRITLLSFRTFGDYVLKAPFLFELARLYPDAEVTMVTNRKGGEVYPLIDSRLKVVVVEERAVERPCSRVGAAKTSDLRPKAFLIVTLIPKRRSVLCGSR